MIIINRIIHIKNGVSQHIKLTPNNPFEIPNIYINKSDDDGYYILYSDSKLSKGNMVSTINKLKTDKKIKKIKWN
tara:strand:+ start:72967 stop:73191 length:225 start_codon:yes stop_codon:yes gene_type:complete